MQIDDTNKIANENGESHIPQDIVEQLLMDKLRNNIAPYALEIDCPALLQWTSAYDQSRFRHQNLIKELRAWSPFLARKPITRTYVNEPFSLMDAPSLTELILSIGQHLKLLHGHHSEHAVTLRQENLTRQNLALLQGLEFNHIQLLINQDFDLQELRVHKEMLRDFKFEHFSLQLEFGSSSLDFLMHLMELLSFIARASVCFSQHIGSPLQHVERDGLTALLMQFGYYLKGNGTLLQFNSPLHKRPKDFVRLGPGSDNQFSSLRLVNFSDADAYQRRLDQLHLPIATCTQ